MVLMLQDVEAAATTDVIITDQSEEAAASRDQQDSSRTENTGSHRYTHTHNALVTYTPEKIGLT